ncbi:hypothetical protein Tco_0822956 [Tanacetum coccineum]|uniref:Transposase n=1 Tax=Tanacetum coccineum TaxID=301880 RepID=A0ABQ5AJ50_9ASTR
MAEEQAIVYAPQWNNMTVDNNNILFRQLFGVTSLHPKLPAYKPIMNFLLNCPLNKAFTNCPSVLYQNYLREFWSTIVAYDPFPSTDETEQCPLKEFLIKFLVLNGQRPLTLDFNTFCSSTGLDYKNGKYVAHPTPEVVKKKLGKIAINPSYLDKTLILKNSFGLENFVHFCDSDVRAFRLSNDEAQESEEAILGAGDEVDEDSQPAAVQHQSSPPQADKPQSSTTSYTEASNSDSSSDDLLKKYDNILPLTKRQLEKYLRKVSSILFNRTNKLVEASMSSLDKSSTAISDLYKGLNIITKLLKEINNVVKDDPVVNKKISEAIETFTMISTNITKVNPLSLPHSNTFSHSHSSKCLAENEINTALCRPSVSYEGRLTVNKQEKSKEPKHATNANIEFIGSSTPQPSATQAQPITIINPEPIIPQREGKGIATDEHAEDQRKLVKASSIIEVHLDKEEQIKKAKEESRLLVINKPEVIKVVREEAKKLGIHPKEAITAKAGEKFKKAQDAKHEVLKKKPTEKVRKSLELKKHKYDNYMWTISSRLKLEKITEIKMHPKTKPVVITVYRGTDGRNFDVHNPFAFRFIRVELRSLNRFNLVSL